MKSLQPQAIVVLPHLRVQNANAISSPLTHGFPSITAFTGLMWALQRKLAQAQIPLRLLSVGVVCHHHQEQVSRGFVQTFNLRKPNVATKEQAAKLEKGEPPAIVEEGRIHLQVSLVFAVALQPGTAVSALHSDNQQKEWAAKIGDIVAQMRVAGGSLLPSRPVPGKKVSPWMAVIAEDPSQRAKDFRTWRRQWLPGFALVARDDVLADRLTHLRQSQPDATVLDAWLHAAPFNYEALPAKEGAAPVDGKVQWGDPLRKKGDGWLVPIPVGYTALSPSYAAGTVSNARDMATPLRFVESVYSMGQWISPHWLEDVQQLLWGAESDVETGLYRCRNGYNAPQLARGASDGATDDDWDEEDDDYVDD